MQKPCTDGRFAYILKHMHTLSHRRRALTAMSIAMAAAAFSAPLHKLALEAGMPAVTLSMLRMAITALIITPITLARGDTRIGLRAVSRRDFLLSLLSGAMLAAHFSCWALSLTMTDAFAATTLCNMNVAFSVVGSILLFREFVVRRAWPGLIMALAGATLLSMGGFGAGASGSLRGNLVALLSGAAMSGYYLCGREVRKRLSMACYTAIVYCACAAALVALTLILGQRVFGFPPIAYLAAAGLSLICTFAGHSMQSYAIRDLGATTLSVAMLSEAITGPLLVWAILGQAAPERSLPGGALIIAGILVYTLASSRRGRTGTDAIASDQSNAP